MAVYRPKRRISPFIIVLSAVVLAAAAVIIFLTVHPVSAPPSPLANARAKALEAAESLDVFSIEYPKYVQGQSSGATAALSRAKSAFTAQAEALRTIDAQAVEQLINDFSTLDSKFAAKGSPGEVTGLAEEMRMRLLALGNSK